MKPSKTLVHNLLFSSKNIIFHHSHQPQYTKSHIQTYVNVSMKWKKDPFFDSIDSIHKSLELKPIISLKNYFISSSSTPQDNYSIPISSISKKGSDFGITIKVARFLRNYPSFFEEFEGPLYNLPWFRLTHKAIELDKQERIVYEVYKGEILERVKKLVLMSGSKKVVPLKIIKGLRWYLGLPDEFFKDPLGFIGEFGCFKVVDIEDGLKGLAVFEDGEGGKVLSVLERNAMRRGVYGGGGVDEAIAFPLFPSKGLRLKHKIKDWLVEFQRLPYVSPYTDFSCLDSDSDLSEKRVVGVLHELLCLFVEHAAERRLILVLRKYLGLPQKLHRAFVRHPHMFYLSLKNNTCTAILKEAYCDNDEMAAIEPHPLAKVRKEYISLMMESVAILRNKRSRSFKTSVEDNASLEVSSCTDDEKSQMA